MTDNLIYGFPREIHEAAERIIKNDIYCCDSALISDLLADHLLWIDTFSADQIENLSESIEQVLERWEVEEPENYALYHNHLEDGSLRSICDTLEDSRETQEIFEWWRVSEFLADQLSSLGQPILRNCYGTWWGRCATGQAIILDGTIQQVIQSI